MNNNFSDEVVCPYCGHEFSESYEFGIEEGSTSKIDCYNCGKEFEATLDIRYYYSTYKVGEERK